MGVITAKPHRRMTPQHMVWICTMYSSVQGAFVFILLKALFVEDIKFCADFKALRKKSLILGFINKVDEGKDLKEKETKFLMTFKND